MSTPRLKADTVSKEFSGVRVLDRVSIEVAPGEVHAVIGENGAGKSTLMKILGGLHQPSEGTIEVDGEPVRFSGTGEAEDRGIVLIHQEFNLAESMTVEENIFLGRERRWGPFLRRGAMRKASQTVLARLRSTIDPRACVGDLSVSEKQMVEIAKAVSRRASVLIMDEPTAVLTGPESAVLFGLIAQLKAEGVSILYVSHRLDEVKQISDRVTVLRDGMRVHGDATANLTTAGMANQMVGREFTDMFPQKRVAGINGPGLAAHKLAVEHITVPGWAEDVSFTLHRGEILGFAGLMGAGRTEFFEGLLGLRARAPGGSIRRDGAEVSIRSYRDAVRAGIVYLSEDRKGRGLHVKLDLQPNVTMLALERFCRGPFVNAKSERAALETCAKDFALRSVSLDVPADTLSGGNQQKIALGKILQPQPEILVLDEPTRGIDVGTKRQIYQFIADLAAAGRSVIVISSELEEIIGLCHRVMVMRNARIVGELRGDELNEIGIMHYATGVNQAS